MDIRQAKLELNRLVREAETEYVTAEDFERMLYLTKIVMGVAK